MPENEVIVKIDNRKKLQAQIEELVKRSVLVGIPETTGPTMQEFQGGVISNATLGYIHEKGSIAKKIPPRPWLAPGVRDSRSRWERHMVDALSAALSLSSSPGDADKALERAGQVAVAAVKRGITNKIPPPLKPATIMARRNRHKGRKAGKPLPGETKTQAAIRAAGHEEIRDGVKVLVGSDVTPLVDTGAFFRSISYVVEK